MRLKTLLALLFIGYCFIATAQEGNTIRELVFEGNKKTKTSFLEKLIKVKVGHKIDSTKLDADVLKLRRLDGIVHATYEIENTLAGAKVTYEVNENFTIIPNLNLWTVNDQEVAYRIGLTDFNFLGRNISIGGFYQNNGFNSYGLSFRAPYLFTNKIGLELNHLNWSSREPLFFENGSAQYKYTNKSFEALGLYELNFNNNFKVGLNYFSETYNYLEGQTNPRVPRSLKIDKWLVKLNYEFNNVVYDYYHLSGIKNQVFLQFVTSTNEFQEDFVIAWNDFFYYKRIGKKGNWANRFRFGVASNEDSPFAPFSVDNNLNIRGVGNIIDRGTASLVLNTEYRQTLIEKGWFILQGNAFVDAGSWRNPGGDFSDFWDVDNVRVYPGVGLRFIHKRIYNAIFRIDYGYGITEGASRGIVFGIGQYF
ncbi:POTRA domain-containing protein [Spongiivirga citrea]|uniref:Outer membrane protein assembly factor n=1 Tax=Spongiivirga citrea TaxID=1481457 RepID=A0A6M0CJQ3_9FLAO|nr:POTRA domain-containing protein [Spongiivirga citrea]NER18185.1 outer membrane protein assembly factor [Spongiivirga citrea]